MKKSGIRSKVESRSLGDFACSVPFNASRDRVFEAIATIDGLRGWWTPITGGSTAPGHQLRFEFRGLDDCIIMRVDSASRPVSVHWTCLMHTELTEWDGTKVKFDLAERTSETCELNFRHVGLTSKLRCYHDCRQGWEHFLASLVAFVERGKGMPFV